MKEVYYHRQDFTLESGITIPGYHLAYTTYGKLNKKKDNVVWIFHALTANSLPSEWWPGLVGEDRLFNPEEHFIVCVNMPGSCYGSFSPLDINTTTGEIWYHDFPWFTIKDMVRAYKPLKDFLQIERIKIGIGGSTGGQQLLEWATEDPELFEYIIPMATNAIHSPWGIAFNATQRMCIEADSSWKEKHNKAGEEGMKAARALALLSYRHYDTYKATQPRPEGYPFSGHPDAESYQRYQGEKLANRFNAFSYYFLSKAMDSHDLGRNRKSLKQALNSIRAKTLMIGIENDILFPVEEQIFAASHIPDSKCEIIKSTYGHDGFLLEYEQIESLIRTFIPGFFKNKILKST